jgi:hypothetical protein
MRTWTSVGRRCLLGLAGTVLPAIALGQTVAEPAPTTAAYPPAATQLRLRWQDFAAGSDGETRMASFERAVARMRSLDSSPPTSADFRRSWRYWANIHGYYGAQSPDGTVAQQIQWLQRNGMGQYVPYYQGIADQTAPDDVARATWAKCQHSGRTQAVNFFGWHRMYLYYFERVLRWASGDDTLRLPYWDYTDPAQLGLPVTYRVSGSPLWDGKRDPGMNSGASSLDADSTDIDDLLPMSSYFAYELQIERGVHGYVHCTVGPTCPVAHMGDVPVAAGDPVFYSHHANIDRMWACWQSLHPTPEGSWQDQQFSFPDETGTLQTRPVRDFVSTAALGYQYDNVTHCARTTAPPGQPAPTPPGAEPPGAAPPPSPEVPTEMIGAQRAVSIDRPSVNVNVDVPRPALQEALGDLATPGRVLLVLRDVTAASHPGVLFDVFLARRDDPSRRAKVGTLSWFGAFRLHGEEHPHARTFTFDVTDELAELGPAGAAAAGLTVVIEATDGRQRPTAEAAAAARQEAARLFRAEAGLRIGAIELHDVLSP